MNREIGEKWVAALRSGDYEQYTTGGLKSPVVDNRMCCLGVLADLYAKEHGVEWVGHPNRPIILGESNFLPLDVRKWAGLSGIYSNNPLVKFGYYQDEPEEHDIAFLNDSGKVPFPMLADLIEEQLIEAGATL